MNVEKQNAHRELHHDDPTVQNLLKAYSQLNWSQKQNFMQGCIELTRGERKQLKRMLVMWVRAVHSRVQSRAEIWIEGRYRKNMKLRPSYVGVECASRLRIQKTMVPYLIRLSRRVKDRLRKREAAMSYSKSQKQS